MMISLLDYILISLIVPIGLIWFGFMVMIGLAIYFDIATDIERGKNGNIHKRNGRG